MENTPKLWVRQASLEDAIASAGRLSAKYGRGQFAIVWDDCGFGPTFDYPYSIVASSTLRPATSAR